MIASGTTAIAYETVATPDGTLPLLTPMSIIAGRLSVQFGARHLEIETLRPISHSHPTYVEAGLVHFGVPNMPGATPWTATQSLNNSTLPYVLTLANHGLEALSVDPALTQGLNVAEHKLVHPAVQAVFPDLKPQHQVNVALT